MKLLLIFIVFLYISSSIFSLSTKNFLMKSLDPKVEKVHKNLIKFTCNKQNIQKMIDPRYELKFIMDDYMSEDKTLRFIASDVNLSDSRYAKLYFKGDPKNCEFHNHSRNPSFQETLEDCTNHKKLVNRLYNRPANNDNPLTKNDKPIYDSIRLPQCISSKEPQGIKTHYLNIFELPSGEDLGTKCIVKDNLTKNNSCMIHLRKVSKAVLKVLTLFNAGKRFYKHGNLIAQNIYLYEGRKKRSIFIDNMLYDPVKYDDSRNKPFKSDFNMLADLLISLITGSQDFKLKEPKNTFDVYSQIKKYYKKNQLPVSLKTLHLNMPMKFMSTRKCVTLTELDWLLRDTFFNFVYRLKCTKTNKPLRFIEINQALQHGFLLNNKISQTWDALPAEY